MKKKKFNFFYRELLFFGNVFHAYFKKWGRVMRYSVPFVFLLVLLPISAGATNSPGFPYWGPLVSCTGLSCVSLCDLILTAQNVIYFGITLVVLVISPIFLLWGGITMIISGGSEERWRSGKKILVGAIVGLFLTLGAFVIVNTVLFVVGAKISGNGSGGVAWPNIDCKAN